MTLLVIENEATASRETQASDAMIDMYTKPDCMQCGMTYRLLIELGIDFEAHNVTENEDALTTVKNLGYLQAPVAVTKDGNHWSGFNADRIKEFAAQLTENGVNLIPYERDFAQKLMTEIKDLIKQGVAKVIVINGEIIVPELAA